MRPIDVLSILMEWAVATFGTTTVTCPPKEKRKPKEERKREYKERCARKRKEKNDE